MKYYKSGIGIGIAGWLGRNSGHIAVTTGMLYWDFLHLLFNLKPTLDIIVLRDSAGQGAKEMRGKDGYSRIIQLSRV